MTEPYYQDASLVLSHGKCEVVLKGYPDATFDSVVCDPPYELTAGKKGGTGVKSNNPNSPAGRSRIGTGFMGKAWDGSGVAFSVEMWAEVLRVLKPGGHLIAFGGSRTWHRLQVAIEDAGFEIRDSIAWLYGSGFPKSLDVSKAIDKAAGAQRAKVRKTGAASAYSANAGNDRPWMRKARDEGFIEVDGDKPATAVAASWEGWGTALKPGFEPIVVARKPLDGTVAANVLKHGTGALNIDAARVGATGGTRAHTGSEPNRKNSVYGDGMGGNATDPDFIAGRWPTNVVLTHSPLLHPVTGLVLGDACAFGCVPGCAIAELDVQTGTLTSGVLAEHHARAPKEAGILGAYGSAEGQRGYGDSGGASRYFPTFRYEAKAPGSERPEVDGTSHATVKPLALMQWCVRLVTRPGGRVLDHFAGSGTTGEAALLEGMAVDLIEMEAEHLPLIVQRVKKPLQQSLFDDVDVAARAHPAHPEIRSSGWSGTEQPFDFEGIA